MTYQRKTTLTLTIDETFSDDEYPSFPPAPAAEAVETTGETISETQRPLAKCRSCSAPSLRVVRAA